MLNGVLVLVFIISTAVVGSDHPDMTVFVWKTVIASVSMLFSLLWLMKRNT